MKICHFTSVHSNNDIRIFIKECVSLATNGCSVYLVAKGESGEKNNVKIIGLGNPPTSRLLRFLFFSKNVYKKALELNCDIYHFHDPELLFYGLKLKKKGKIVIFDSHENVSAQINNKMWIPSIFRSIISFLYRKYEIYVTKKLDGIVTATENISLLFKNYNKNVVAINNYPKIDDIVYNESSFIKREPIVCYAGGISKDRGIDIIIELSKRIKARFLIAGKHEKEELGNLCFLGILNRNEINELYQKSVVGLCILKPTPNYINSKPIKMYEYMAAGLPFICSNFDLWQKETEITKAGICVNPFNIDEIVEKINYLLENRYEAQCMGKRGYQYVINNCNWQFEEKKLLNFYKKFIK